MLVVENLLRGVDAHNGIQLCYRSIGTGSEDFQLTSVGKFALQQFWQAGNFVDFIAVEPVALSIFLGKILQWQNAHAYQVRAMNTLVTLRNHRPYAQQVGAFGSPVAGRA